MFAPSSVCRKRIACLLDRRSFRETGGSEVSDLSPTPPGDGVVCGWGTVDGRKVYVFSEDAAVKGGSVGKVHAAKIADTIRAALRDGCPVIGLTESGGARINEYLAGLSGYGDIFRANVEASGKIPQIAVILGACAGGACYSPALMDAVFFVRGEAKMFLTGPAVVKSVLFQDVSPEDLGGAAIHAESGVVHFMADSEEECLRKVRALLSYLPSNSREKAPLAEPEEPGDADIAGLVPADSRKAYDMHKVVSALADGGTFLEWQAEWGSSMLTLLCRIGGASIGIVASQPAKLGGAIDDRASQKVSRFVRFCDCFNLPVVTLVDVPAFLPGVEMEKKGIIRHGAKILYAYAEATVPKVTVILRKAYGGAYIALGSKAIGADRVYAWPAAEVAVMGAEGAVRILHRREIAAGADESSFLADYRKKCGPESAAAAGYIDGVISPEKTREVIMKSLEELSSKPRGPQHGNIPL